MLLTAWWILSKISFYCGFFIAVHVGLTEKYLINGIKFLLNSELLLKITLRGLWYLDSHTSLNIWDIIAEDWSMIGNYDISNHPIDRSIKLMHNNWSSFVNFLLSGCLNLDCIVSVTMRSTHTVCHGVNVSESVAGSNPYLEFFFLNFWKSLQVMHGFRDWSTITDQLQTVVNIWAGLSPPGCWR